ncbi:MAG: sugar transferase [Clostridia bacterium]|nr:sugar transferase [Clostridia bacterium]
MDKVETTIEDDNANVKENIVNIATGVATLGRRRFRFRRETYNEVAIEPNTTVVAPDSYKKENVVVKALNVGLKRTMDIMGALVGILFLIPLTVIIAILNLVNKENGPLFYAQKRIGKDGKVFKMYKFRTMIVGADEKLKEILANNEDLRKEWKENRKLKNDPRITKIGNFMRKTSLDEFPQFVNVLMGSMSLVGPRAVVDDEIEKFGEYKKDVLSVKPGITGYWAANGRSETSYEERVYMETKYARNWSVWMDIKILFKTVLSVVKKEGAV